VGLRLEQGPLPRVGLRREVAQALVLGFLPEAVPLKLVPLQEVGLQREVVPRLEVVRLQKVGLQREVVHLPQVGRPPEVVPLQQVGQRLEVVNLLQVVLIRISVLDMKCSRAFLYNFWFDVPLLRKAYLM
jgi:hypothetical protein